MKMFCGFYKPKKSPVPSNKNEFQPEPQPIASRVASTVITQKSPKTILDISKLECFKNETVLKNYQIIEKIGGGSFGEIYKVRSLVTNEILAMKIEKKRPEKNLLLLKEKQILVDFLEDYGFPRMSTFIKGDCFSYIVMSYLGENLEALKKKLTNKFSLKTVLMIGYQIMERIETLHSKNYLHRDIKPENFVIGSGGNYKTIYLIDFGLSKSYIEDNEHIPFRDRKGMVGTARYASINTHIGFEQSRRDDLEAIGYILVYFAKGRLPWQNIYAKNKEQKYAQILHSKQKVNTEQLCLGLPNEFMTYFNYVRNLGFTSKPDYKFLKQLFLTMMKNNDYKMDYEFDWLSLYSRNPSSMDMNPKEEGINSNNKLDNYIFKNNNQNNIAIINVESSNKIKSPKNDPKNFNNNINKKLSRSKIKKNKEKAATSDSDQSDCDVKEDEQIKIQETYNTMRPKLIRSSIKKIKRNADGFMTNFRGKFLKFRKINEKNNLKVIQCDQKEKGSSNEFYVSFEQIPFKK